jgi:hypothetical protein
MTKLPDTPSPPYGECPLREAEDVLQDCRRYLTEFGSVEPSSLVRRVNEALTAIRRERDERCYLWQLASVNGIRIREGGQPLTYSQFMSGCFGDAQ